jgi:hypothetical protein
MGTSVQNVAETRFDDSLTEVAGSSREDNHAEPAAVFDPAYT